MYLDGLDELDQKIIRLLIENARISYSDIGEETGIFLLKKLSSQIAGQGGKYRSKFRQFRIFLRRFYCP